MGNAIQITGTGMAVLLGVVLIISPWTMGSSLGSKFLMTILGGFLCWFGILFSKG